MFLIFFNPFTMKNTKGVPIDTVYVYVAYRNFVGPTPVNLPKNKIVKIIHAPMRAYNT